MALSGQPQRAALKGRRWLGGRIGLAGLLSLLVHIVIGVLLLVTIRREEGAELLPPPAPVTMVFESGRRAGPTEPEPSLQATPGLKAPPAAEIPLPTPPEPPPLQGQLPPLVEAPPAVAPAPAQQPPPSVAEQVPVQPPPAVAQAPMQPPPPVVEQAPAQPLPPLVEQAPVQPPLAAKQVPTVKTPAPPPEKPTAPAKPAPFPAPMNYSFGTPRSRAPVPMQSRPHIPGTIDMSLGPATRGTANATPFSNHNEEADGADWRNALSRWVSEHAYYPEQARREAEEGDARVHVVAEPNGRVKTVELVGRSGSMWLDLALLALFRDQRIPPLPFGVKEPIEFDFTMHYILIRRR